MQLGEGLKGYIKFFEGGSRVQGCIEGSFFGKAELTGELVDDVGVDPVEEWKRSGGEEGMEDDYDDTVDVRMAGDNDEADEEKPREATKPRTKQTARRGGAPPFGTIRVPANTPFRSTGSYTIVAEDFAGLCSSYFDEENMTLDVRPSSTGAHLWGKFDFGALSGVFRSRDSEAVDGRTWYDEGQTGFIKFLSGGRIKGYLEGYMAKGDFTGQLFEEEVDLSEVAEWKSEWRSLNEADSIASSKSRWGTWTAELRADRAAALDTSGGEGDSMDVDEDEYY
ncbi:hypothetical protein K523DRAFT_419152 [Schizophyllum commune Tattone D]|nr:hypothetical protein K525DRAFT_267343 [Schizophyllum commune Loenen D]KAI5826562.1 hypothetical protein K523DRAFT_419152 [Schizophyllum commune Tattone D]